MSIKKHKLCANMTKQPIINSMIKYNDTPPLSQKPKM